jgi:hypothetical protein
MSRSFKKHIYYLSPLADQPQKGYKRTANKRVRRFRDVSDGAWYKKLFDSDVINGWISWRVWLDNKTITKNPKLKRK